MRIHQEESLDTTRYIENHRDQRLEDWEPAFRNYIRHIERFRTLDPSVRMLEIGTGTGWFPLMCKRRGLNCRGLEISPQLIAYAHELGARYGVQPDIELGNIEDSGIAPGSYDVVVAMSVFEHVEHWRHGLERVYEVLAPGGLLLFESTNKFSFTSGEYGFPLYGWLPDAWRYRMRIAAQGQDIMKLGIDFNQFRYGLLRRTFRELGFREIHDRLQIHRPESLAGFKRTLTAAAQALPPLRHALLTFMPTTNFVCIK